MAGRISTFTYILSLLVPTALVGAGVWVVLHRDLFLGPAFVQPYRVADTGDPSTEETPDEASADSAAQEQAARAAQANVTASTRPTQPASGTAGRGTNPAGRNAPGSGTPPRHATGTATGGAPGSTASAGSTTSERSTASAGTSAPPASTGASSASGATATPTDWKNREIIAPLPKPNVVVYAKSGVVLLRNDAEQVRVYQRVKIGSALIPATSAAYRTTRATPESVELIPYRDGDTLPDGHITSTGTELVAPNLIDMQDAHFDELRTALQTGTIVFIVNQ